MKKNYKAKSFTALSQGLFIILLLAGRVFCQTTYTFSFTGSVQTINLPAGTYSIECWGAIGGWHANDANMFRGKGGYSSGTISLTTSTNLYIAVGGAGGTQVGTTVPGGWNGGGPGKYYTYAFNSGGGASHVATVTGILSSLSTNTSAVLIVAAGGAGGATSQTPGNGGGLIGGNSTRSGCTGGTQSSPGASSIAGGNAVFGQGWDANLSGGSYGAGGGGWYGGGCESGGSSYIGGVNNGTTIAFGQTNYVNNPDLSGNGLVLIKELCSFNLTASTANSLNPSICSGQSLTLTTNAISNYSWSTGATTSSLVVSPTISTVYALTATSPSNCTTTRSISVTVSGGQPTLSVVSSTNQTCLGKTATLTASGAVTYTWTNGVTNGVSFFPQSTNSYTVTGENGCGTVTAVSTISILPLPLTVVTSNSVVCTNKTATLAATAAATSYTWQPGNIIGASPNLIINPQANTNYTITATDGTCVGVANVSVNANPVPTIQIASSATTACPGDVVTFTASGGSNYTWTANNQTGATLSTSLSTTTLIAVQGDNQFGCISNTSQVVSVQTAPTINVATASSSICAGGSSTLNVTGATNYTWTGGSNGNSYVVNPSQTTVYSVDGSNSGNPCIATRTLEVTVFTPVLTITGNTVICNGAQTNLTAGSASTYTWSHEPSFPNALTNVNPSSNTVYSVNATHEFNGGQVKCPISGTVEVIVNPTPSVSAVASRTTMCAKESNTLNANGASTYTWVTTNTTIAASSLTINPATATILTYTVNGTSTQGCEGSTVFLFNVSGCTGIEVSNSSSSFVNIYPNPSQGDITIESVKNMQLKLINQLGQVIEVIELNEKNNYKTSLTNLSNGVYFISGDGLNKKVIVNK